VAQAVRRAVNLVFLEIHTQTKTTLQVEIAQIPNIKINLSQKKEID
jgi:hypothetical protein